MNWAMKMLLAAYTPPLWNKVRKPAGFLDTFRGGLTRSWIVQGLSAAAGRGKLGESFTLPLPLLSQAACGLPDTFGGGLTRSWIVQGLSVAVGRVQSGESFTLPAPSLSRERLRPPRHPPWGGLTRSWIVQESQVRPPGERSSEGERSEPEVERLNFSPISDRNTGAA